MPRLIWARAVPWLAAYFRITFDDGSEVVWGFHPLILRGDHMARLFATEKEAAEAKLDKRQPRTIKSVEDVARP